MRKTYTIAEMKNLSTEELTAYNKEVQAEHERNCEWEETDNSAYGAYHWLIVEAQEAEMVYKIRTAGFDRVSFGGMNISRLIENFLSELSLAQLRLLRENAEREAFYSEKIGDRANALKLIDEELNRRGQRQILNLTQHQASAEQVADGVVEPADKETVKQLLTFNSLPTREEIEKRAEALVNIVKEAKVCDVMLGGAPYLMGVLEVKLKAMCITPLYSFTERRSEDQPQPDGSIKKVAVFRHIGWVEA